jgi:DnaK suppressor protein
VKIDARSGLTEQQVEQAQEQLLQARRSLLERVRARARGRQAAPSNEPRGDAGDQAELSLEQAVWGELSEADSRLLREIEDALARIDEGRYGLCEGTGEPIGWERLAAQPWTRYSLEYEEQLEAAAGPRTPPTL